MTIELTNLTIAQLRADYKTHRFTPLQLMEFILGEIDKHSDNPVWIQVLTIERIQHYVDALSQHDRQALPLYGIPFAIKDNIDLAGIPTTAACPDFAYTPGESAYVVELLIKAGAIPIGKTNLDQFATGLVGTRSPYGITRCALNDDYLSGGSSSGSAVAVATGLVSFSLGTDTAGSGRVPAAFNNIAGWKPTRGLVSNRGVVPACKSLDCVSVFAGTVADLDRVADVIVSYDEQDEYSRKTKSISKPYAMIDTKPGNGLTFQFAVPRTDQLEFYGNTQYENLFTQCIKELQAAGGERVEIDFSSFREAADLLYQGPWVTERYLATRNILESKPEAMLEVTRSIIQPGKDLTAQAAFESQYRLHACKVKTDAILQQCNFLLTPTTATQFTIQQEQQAPIELNSQLGYYTNYMNLLDYSCVAVPYALTEDKLGFGVSLVSLAHSDKHLLRFGKLIHEMNATPNTGLNNGLNSDLNIGATPWQLPDSELPPIPGYVDVVVCGAHLQGLPLNHQLTERAARLVKSCNTASAYSLYALPGGPPYRPGLVRDEGNGKAIEVEVWRLPEAELGSFLHGIPYPLGLGKVELDNGDWCTGFMCEHAGINGAKDITDLGGWRSYLEQIQQQSQQ